MSGTELTTNIPPVPEPDEPTPPLPESLPPALRKAVEDCSFSYALGLVDGTVIEFVGAAYLGAGWFHLYSPHEDPSGSCPRGEWERPGPVSSVPSLPFARGLDVRLDRIAWVADCPTGS